MVPQDLGEYGPIAGEILAPFAVDLRMHILRGRFAIRLISAAVVLVPAIGGWSIPEQFLTPLL
jgi:hypothetical protein